MSTEHSFFALGIATASFFETKDIVESPTLNLLQGNAQNQLKSSNNANQKIGMLSTQKEL